MKILKYKKLLDGKYKIYIEGGKEIILYEDVIVKNNLLIEKNIDEKLLKKLLKDNNDVSVYSTALKYISIRMRSKKEIIDYLEKKSISNEFIKKTTDKLEKEGYINDSLFAKAYIKDQILLNNTGPNKIKGNLEKLGVNEDIISEELSKIETKVFKEKLHKLMEKQLKIKKGSISELKLKLLKYFSDLGYSKQNILNEFENFTFKNDLNLLKKEYIKLHTKYSKKLNGAELDYFVFNKLRIKGYCLEEINKIKKELSD